MRQSYKGLTWKELTDEERWSLLIEAHAVDGRTGDDCNEGGPCMVDFPKTKWAIAGHVTVQNGNQLIRIEDDAEFYDPTEFVHR